MRLNLLEVLYRLNASHWFVPLVVTSCGAGLAVLLLVLDELVPPPMDDALWLLRPQSAEGARELLSVVIGAMITAVSVTFSVSIVALTVAAQHFGPRVLNSFVRHTSAQVVLGTFMATFTYSVLVLGAISGTGAEADVPELGVSGAVLLVFGSIGALIYYVHHVATSLQIGELAADIAQELRGSLSRLHDSYEDDPGRAMAIPEVPGDAAPVPARASGYVQRIDYEAIASLASERDALIWIRREPGAFVVSGTPLALVHPPEARDEAFVETVHRACITGCDRTLWHDPEFAVKQLVEVALRALSPGVNEPFTAMTCIDRLTEGLAGVAAAPPPRTAWGDHRGVLRVFTQAQPFDVLLRASFDPIRIFAGPNPAIYARLLEGLVELSFIAVRERDCDEVRHQADVVHRAALGAVTDEDDRAFIEARYAHAVRQFSGRAAATRR